MRKIPLYVRSRGKQRDDPAQGFGCFAEITRDGVRADDAYAVLRQFLAPDILSAHGYLIFDDTVDHNSLIASNTDDI